MATLELKEISVRFGGLLALSDISFSINSGSPSPFFALVAMYWPLMPCFWQYAANSAFVNVEVPRSVRAPTRTQGHDDDNDDDDGDEDGEDDDNENEENSGKVDGDEDDGDDDDEQVNR